MKSLADKGGRQGLMLGGLARLSAVVALLAACSSVFAQPGGPDRENAIESGGERPGRLALVYQVYAGGLHAFSSASQVALGPAGYDVKLALHTDGWLAWLLDYAIEAEVAGKSGAAGLTPHRFRTDSAWRGRERWVQVTYDGRDAPLVEAQPPLEDDDRDRVPKEQQIGTVDPITASLLLLHSVQRSGRCDSELAVFDGRRRFAASAEHIGDTHLVRSELAPFGGEATACLLRIMPVSGFSKDPDRAPKTHDVTVYLRPVVAAWPPLPVRLEAETRFGALRAHLVSVAPTDAQEAAR